MGSVWCICARGTCSGPSRCWSGPWVCARTGTFRSSCPGMAAALGLAYALDGRVAAGLALVEHGVEQAGRQGQSEKSGAHGRLAQRGVSAGGPPGRGAPTRCAGARPCPPVPATRPPGLGPVAPGREHGAPGVPRGRARRRPLPPGPRPGRGAGHAPAPGALPPRPRHAVCADRPAGAGPYRAVYCYRRCTAPWT